MLNNHKPEPRHCSALWPRARPLVCAALLLALGCRLALAQPLPFGLFGDTPYSAGERAQLPGLMADMALADPAFVVHTGDFKSGGDAGSDALSQDRLALFLSPMNGRICGTMGLPSRASNHGAHSWPIQAEHYLGPDG